jgi:hypothetical protein
MRPRRPDARVNLILRVNRARVADTVIVITLVTVSSVATQGDSGGVVSILEFNPRYNPAPCRLEIFLRAAVNFRPGGRADKVIWPKLLPRNVIPKVG